MKLVVRRFGLATMTLLAAMAVLLVSCGGGITSEKPSASKQAEDPALAPSSTPLQNPPVYVIIGDTITSSTGATTTVAAGATAGTTSSSQTYTVVDGDTCYGIAAQFGISIDDLYHANGGSGGTCATLTSGNIMRIPLPASSTPDGSATPATGASAAGTPTPGASTGGQTYTVQDGDTCFGVAIALGVDPDEFVAANSAACNNLHEGDTLRIP